jgi:hypothetical protein
MGLRDEAHSAQPATRKKNARHSAVAWRRARAGRRKARPSRRLFLALGLLSGVGFPHVRGHVDLRRLHRLGVEIDLDLIGRVSLDDFEFELLCVAFVDLGYLVAALFEGTAIVVAAMPDTKFRFPDPGRECR